MKYHAFLLFLKKRQNLKLSSTANYRQRFMGEENFFVLSKFVEQETKSYYAERQLPCANKLSLLFGTRRTSHYQTMRREYVRSQ